MEMSGDGSNYSRAGCLHFFQQLIVTEYEISVAIFLYFWVKEKIFFFSPHLSPGLWGNAPPLFFCLFSPCSLISLHGEVPLMACCGPGCFGGAGACRYRAFTRMSFGVEHQEPWEPVTNRSVERKPRRHGRLCKAANASNTNEIPIMNECSSFSPWAREEPAYYRSFHATPGFFSSSDPTSDKKKRRIKNWHLLWELSKVMNPSLFMLMRGPITFAHE